MLVAEQEKEYTAKQAAAEIGVNYKTIINWKNAERFEYRRDIGTGDILIKESTVIELKKAYALLGPRFKGPYKKRKQKET